MAAPRLVRHTARLVNKEATVLPGNLSVLTQTLVLVFTSGADVFVHSVRNKDKY